MQPEARTFIWRGAVAGAAGGLASALLMLFVTQGPIGDALAIEAAGNPGDDGEMFSRSTQVVGGMAAALLYGICLGLVYGVVLARMWHRLPGDEFGRAARLAGAGFAALALVPALKYPANPPAVGDPDTVDSRTANFLTFLIASVVLLYLAWWLWCRLTSQGVAGARRFAATAAAYGAAVGLAFLVWPATNDVIEVPATVVWHLRIDSIAQHGLMWAVIAVTFGLMAEASAAARRRQAEPATAPRP